MTDPLIQQYNAYAYPAPILDLDAYVRNGGRDLSDPATMRRKFWPKPVEPDALKILVAGCGTNQAAILAHCNPHCFVTGVDASLAAVENHRQLKAKHQLSNLYVSHSTLGDLDTIAAMQGKFDLIICTGVLHHMESPVMGLHALKRVLAPNGVMSLMVYGQHQRQGIYWVQEALRTLNAPRNESGIDLAKEVIKLLPEWHPAQFYLRQAPDLGTDAGLVDTLLNARDRAYSVPEVLRLVDECGLSFQTWLDRLYYTPSAVFPAGSPAIEAIESLPLRDQWHVVDLLTATIGAHRFVVCHPERNRAEFEPDFCGEAWLDYRPQRHPSLKVDGACLAREWQTLQLNADLPARVSAMDGEKTFRQLLSGLDSESLANYGEAFAYLYECDHIFVAI